MSMERAMINTKFWSDNWVLEELDPIEKLLFLYYISNPSRNWAGLYELSLKVTAFHTGIDIDTVKRVTDRFDKVGKIYYTKGYLFIDNFTKYQTYNTNMAKHVESILDRTPKDVLRDIGKNRLISSYEHLNIKLPKLYERATTTTDNTLDDNTNLDVDRLEIVEQKKHSLVEYISSEFKNVSKIKTQLTNEQAEKLLSKYSKLEIVETLRAMENYKGIQ